MFYLVLVIEFYAKFAIVVSFQMGKSLGPLPIPIISPYLMIFVKRHKIIFSLANLASLASNVKAML